MTEEYGIAGVEYGIQLLIPPWSTNPALPAGQPYSAGEILPIRSYLTLVAAEASCDGWEPGTWRVLVRTVTTWRPLQGGTE